MGSSCGPPTKGEAYVLSKGIVVMILVVGMISALLFSAACVTAQWMDILDPNVIYVIPMCVICVTLPCQDPIMIGKNNDVFNAWIYHNLCQIKFMLIRAQVLIYDLLLKCWAGRGQGPPPVLDSLLIARRPAALAPSTSHHHVREMKA